MCKKASIGRLPILSLFETISAFLKSFSEGLLKMRIFNFHAPWIDGCGVLIYTESVKKRQLKYSKL